MDARSPVPTPENRVPRLTARQRLALDAVIVVLGLVLLVALVLLAIRLSEPRVMGGPLYIVRRSPAQRVVALLVLIVKVLVQGAVVGGFCLAVYWRWFRKEGGR